MSIPPQFEAPSPEELHELLPAYDVLAFIAQGGMGAVYKAHQKSLERDVAIKILPREFGEDAEFRKRFADEAKSMARLNHPNLIGVYDFGEVDGMPYIVMEFVDGKSLHHSAHGKAIDQKQVARLVLGICEGLAHAHEAGILHRDIKPANILLDSKKRPKIGDFGLARAADDTEGEGVHFGTPDYTAPEVMKDPGNVDKRSDVYSTGVILYELLTGDLPQKSYVPASQKEGVDPRFDKIVRRAMHPAPAMRFADGEAMAKDLRALKEALEKPVAGIVTSAPPAAILVQGEAAEAAEAAAPPPQVLVQTGHQWNLLRNLVIIVVLLGAIFGMVKAYQWKKQDNARKQVEFDRKKQLEEQERIAEELRKKKEWEDRLVNRPPKRPGPGSTTPPPEKPEPEKPTEILAKMKRSLAGGDRDQFPPGTHERGQLRFFLVETPMTWQRAKAFAESYGGHLATLPNESEQTWLSSKIPKSTTVWLGGGTTGRQSWGWVDGAEWTVRKPSATSSATCVSLSNLGTIRAKPAGEELPFFIQWHMNATNPGDTAAQFARLKESLKTPDPVYPPGTLSFESRRYLILEKMVSWDEAASIAGSAHGHLAVPSEQAENSFLLQAVTNSLPANSSAWLGGQHNGRSWTWATGEPWSFAAWAKDSPDGDTESESAVRMLTGDEGGWDDAAPTDDEAAGALVIEWSKDRETTREVATTAGGGDWAALRDQALKAVQGKQAAHAKSIKENGKSMIWDLDFWHRGLRDNEAKTYAAAVGRIKALVQEDGRIKIPDNQRIVLPPRGVQVVRGYVEKEARIDKDFESELNKVRVYYLKKLEEKRMAAEANGLTSQIRAIENEIRACGGTGSTLLEHFGGGG